MLVTSRSYDEYLAMFALSATDLSGPVLDCSAGAAGFVAEAAARGISAVAVDPAYALPRLPFRDRSFDVVLCSHLLFTWADALGFDWRVDYRFQVSGDQLLVATAADGASGAGNGGGVPP